MSRRRIAIVSVFPLHVIPGLESYVVRGHYATWLPQLALAFEKCHEFDIHWVVCTRQMKSHAPIVWLGQTFHFIHAPTRFSTSVGYWFDTIRIKARLDQLSPELVHGWGTEECSGFAAARSGRKWLLSVQGILANYVRNADMPIIFRLRAALEQRLLSTATHLTVESNWGATIIREMAPRAELTQIEYGVNPLFYSVPWSPESGKPIAIFVGSTEHRKGIQEVIAAFRDPRLIGAELWILGDTETPLGRALRPISTPNVKWLGRKPAKDVAQHLSKSWCLVLPTRADTSPNVVKEARVIGLPVITTSSGGQSDYIQHGKNGFIVQAGDSEDLADRLNEVLSNLEFTRTLGAHNHSHQRDFFRPENTSSAFLALYKRLLEDTDLGKQPESA